MTSLTAWSDGCLAPYVILYHTTVFGSAEHPRGTGGAGGAGARSTDRADAARARISAWLADHGRFAGLVLTTPGAVAWATGGVAPPVDRTAGTDLVWAVFTRTGAGLITTAVEADRVRDEYGPERHGFTELAVVPWHDPGAFGRAAQDVAGAGADDLAADGHPGFGTDAADDLTALRLALSGPEQADLRDLGADAAAALEQAL